MNDLKKYFKENEGRLIRKWFHYFVKPNMLQQYLTAKARIASADVGIAALEMPVHLNDEEVLVPCINLSKKRGYNNRIV